jgi:hypothetical protein
MPKHYGRSMSDRDKSKLSGGRVLSDRDKGRMLSDKDKDLTKLQKRFMKEMRRRGANPIIRDSNGKDTGRFVT